MLMSPPRESLPREPTTYRRQSRRQKAGYAQQKRWNRRQPQDGTQQRGNVEGTERQEKVYKRNDIEEQ